MTNLALTIGDPTGIGTEITVKTLQRVNEFQNLNLIVIGSMKTLEKAAAELQLALPNYLASSHPRRRVSHLVSGDLKGNGMPAFAGMTAENGVHNNNLNSSLNNITYINIEAELPGDVAYQSIETAVKLIADKKADALVTGPISKQNLRTARHDARGHTEILEQLTQKYFDAKDARAEMLFVYKNFRLMLLTRHIALSDVPAAIAKQGAVARPLKTLISYLRKQLKIDDPHIAILGINPHCGEVGGDEEEKYLQPVMKAVNAIGASTLAGPFAADGFFRSFTVSDNPYHAIVATYHDQGLIPFKLLAGYEAVNVTIGLPFLRTSVSHGTAEDIVGKGIANEASMIAALHAALESLEH